MKIKFYLYIYPAHPNLLAIGSVSLNLGVPNILKACSNVMQWSIRCEDKPPPQRICIIRRMGSIMENPIISGYLSSLPSNYWWCLSAVCYCCVLSTSARTDGLVARRLLPPLGHWASILNLRPLLSKLSPTLFQVLSTIISNYLHKIFSKKSNCKIVVQIKS